MFFLFFCFFLISIFKEYKWAAVCNIQLKDATTLAPSIINKSNAIQSKCIIIHFTILLKMEKIEAMITSCFPIGCNNFYLDNMCSAFWSMTFILHNGGGGGGGLKRYDCWEIIAKKEISPGEGRAKKTHLVLRRELVSHEIQFLQMA